MTTQQKHFGWDTENNSVLFGIFFNRNKLYTIDNDILYTFIRLKNKKIKRVIAKNILKTHKTKIIANDCTVLWEVKIPNYVLRKIACRVALIVDFEKELNNDIKNILYKEENITLKDHFYARKIYKKLKTNNEDTEYLDIAMKALCFSPLKSAIEVTKNIGWIWRRYYIISNNNLVRVKKMKTTVHLRRKYVDMINNIIEDVIRNDINYNNADNNVSLY